MTLYFDNSTTFTGECNDKYNTLSMETANRWSLVLNYTLLPNTFYELNSVNFSYVIDNQFPNASASIMNKRFDVMASNLTEFSASKGVSYKCFAHTLLKLNDQVSMDISMI